MRVARRTLPLTSMAVTILPSTAALAIGAIPNNRVKAIMLALLTRE